MKRRTELAFTNGSSQRLTTNTKRSLGTRSAKQASSGTLSLLVHGIRALTQNARLVTLNGKKLIEEGLIEVWSYATKRPTGNYGVAFRL